MNINDYKKVTDRIEPSERCREEVLKMNKRENKIKHKVNKKAIAAIVTVAVAACGGTAAFAARNTDVFNKLMGKKDRTFTDSIGEERPIDKYDIVDYEPISENAVILDEPAETHSEEMSLAIDSVYCDGQNVTLAITGSLADGNPEGVKAFYFDTTLKIGNKVYSTKDRPFGEYSWFEGSLYLDEGAENSFTGSVNLTLKEGSKIRGRKNATLTLSNIHGGGYINRETDCVKEIGDVSVDFEFTPDLSLVNDSDYHVEEDGFVVNIYEMTPAKISCTTDYPDEYKSNELMTVPGIGPDGREGQLIQIPKYSVEILCFDEYGNKIPYLNTNDTRSGLPVGLLTGTSSDVVTFRFINKQMQEEDGSGPLILKEITVDLSQVPVTE